MRNAANRALRQKTGCSTAGVGTHRSKRPRRITRRARWLTHQSRLGRLPHPSKGGIQTQCPTGGVFCFFGPSQSVQRIRAAHVVQSDRRFEGNGLVVGCEGIRELAHQLQGISAPVPAPCSVGARRVFESRAKVKQRIGIQAGRKRAPTFGEVIDDAELGCGRNVNGRSRSISPGELGENLIGRAPQHRR